MPLPVIQQLLGHEDPKTTMIYAAILPEAARRAYKMCIRDRPICTPEVPTKASAWFPMASCSAFTTAPVGLL